MPPAAAGPTPSLGLSYDSGSIDGQTATTNNQGTSVGEGFGLTESYIERSYGSCDDDGHADVFDQCWKYDNASLVLNGSSTQLIKDDKTGTWHLADDDASTVTRSTGADNGDDDGEYWTVITGDGTKYVFGLDKLDGATTQRTNSVWTVPVFGDDSGEPGYSKGDTFADRSLTQAWRWNLDYVEDTRGNAATYWYTKESNYYKKNKAAKASASYTRGGYLTRIEYGLRKGALFTDKADAKVTFDHAERCTASDCSSLTKDTADNWPDVPFDAICSKDDTDCRAETPSFFSRKRLTGINTYSYNAATAAYDPVDSWVLTQRYLDGGDIGDSSDQVLTLTSIKHTGKAGEKSVVLDPVSFTYQMRPNRVDATDDILPLTRPRISTVTSETGAITTVTLSSPECTRSKVLDAAPDSNARSCYPQFWHINGAEDAAIDWFNKYRVLAVDVADQAAGNDAVEYAYDYSGAAWHYSDDPFTPKDERTWSDWRGYQKVTAWTGATAVTRSKTVSLYMQGMDGDKKKDGTTKSVSVAPLLDTDVDFGPAVDRDRYKGVLRQQVTYNGNQPIASTFNNYTYRQTAVQTVPDAAGRLALWVRPTTTYTSTYLTGSKTWRSRATNQHYDTLGMVTSSDDYGQVGKGGDETCTRTWYARNSGLGITSLVSRKRTVAQPCTVTDSKLGLPASSSTRGDVLLDVAAVFDNPKAAGWSAAQKPTKDELTWMGRVTGYAVTADTAGERLPTGWQTVANASYDPLGRLLSETNAAGHTTSIAYTPVDAGPLTKTISTDAKGYRSVNFLDPRRGLALRSYDINLKKTENSYDALGRLTAVWTPDRSRGAGDAASEIFTYHPGNTKPSWVSTSTLKKDGVTYNTGYALYDSLLRPIQTQSPTPQGGRLLTDRRYDTRGLAYETHADIFDTTSTPNGTYTRVSSGEAPRQTETVFDGAGRATSSTLYVFGVKKWSTTTSYTGDSTATTALDGGSAKRTITDVRGQATETREYASVSPADTAFGTGPGASYTSVKFTYAPDGKQASVTGPDGAKWSYGYDLFGRQTSADDPDKGKATAEYNALDQVTKTTDSRGTSLLTAYDELGRPTGTWTGSKTDANQQTAYTYDTVLKGLPTTSTRYVGGKTGAAYTREITQYDTLGRPTATELRLPDSDPFVKAGVPSTLAHETYYNIDGTQQYEKEPALGGLESEIIEFRYDDLGDLTSMPGYLRNATYSALGQPEQLTSGTGGEGTKDVYVTNTYEAGTGRLARSHVTDQTHPYMLQDLNYTYDQTGNVTEINDPTTLGGHTSADTQCFTYDAHQRLTEAWTPASQNCTDTRDTATLTGPAPYWTSYTYNTAGQRLTETAHTGTGDKHTTYCYTSTTQPHTLTGTTTKSDCTSPERSYSYYATGNTKTRPGSSAGQELIWSPEGKLTKLTEAGTSTDYIYDAGGNLLIRSTQDGERVLYDGATELHLRADGTTWAQRYYSAAGITAAMRSNQTGHEKLTFLTGDRHGTSSLALTPDTAQTYTKRYTTPFGADRGTPAYGPWPDDKGFLGKTRDTNTGLTHIGAREYDPTIGQFLSTDPLLSPNDVQSLNGYSYAANNPTTASDPTGLKPVSTCDRGCTDGTDTYRDWFSPNSDGTWGYHWENDHYLYDSQNRVHSIVKRGSDQPTVGTKVTYNHYPVTALTLAIKMVVPDIGEWKACAGNPGLNSHCGWAATDLPLPTKYFKALKLLKLKKLKRAEEAGEAVEDAAGDVADAGKTARHGEPEGTGCSFTPDTPVLMDHGKTKPIAEIKPGDKVEAADPATGKHRNPHTVTATHVNHDYDLIDLRIRRTDGTTATVHTNAKHPFWDDTLHTWVPAGQLQPGHALNTATNHHVRVAAVTVRPGDRDMYNLTVDTLHTYYVLAGATPVLVHNCGEVAVDTNAVTDALSGARTAEVDAALAGRAPVLSPTAHRELLEGGHSADAIGSWLSERGGRMGPASTSEGVASLQARLRGMWKGKSFNPMIADDDASVLHSAIQDGLPIITNDKRFYKNIERLGYSSERY
ncbi:polymorphic toxin-type HINT domain-containing protein [Streptomyces sp. L2]|uniref:polymorphic toxin-type HINT domain-containing protein n=1 Tax=Streptomyces sp. L2 TaxID=2162665 RepID=UPI001F509735|nr:polymorphic toxin-type HINT domain-containing protein [Streptomyces sp. L2]